MALFSKKKKEQEKEEAAKETTETKPVVPKPREEIKKQDPRFLIQLHRNGIQDLKKVETEYKKIEIDYLYNLNILRTELEKVEKQLLDAGYSEQQLIDNKDEALKIMKRENYEFLED